jgi:hypothetical protein
LVDASYLAPRLRERDRDEVTASAGPDILAILRASILASPGMCWAAYDAHPVFVLGCAPVSPGVGSPWLLGTDAVARYPGALTRIAKRHIAIMLRTYPSLVNYVDARNADSVGWLELLGFKVYAPTPYGVEGLPFHRFTMEI